MSESVTDQTNSMVRRATPEQQQAEDDHQRDITERATAELTRQGGKSAFGVRFLLPKQTPTPEPTKRSHHKQPQP